MHDRETTQSSIERTNQYISLAHKLKQIELDENSKHLVQTCLDGLEQALRTYTAQLAAETTTAKSDTDSNEQVRRYAELSNMDLKSARRELEEKLRTADPASYVGQMAASIAKAESETLKFRFQREHGEGKFYKTLIQMGFTEEVALCIVDNPEKLTCLMLDIIKNAQAPWL